MAGYNYIRGEFWEPYERFEEGAGRRRATPGCWARTSSAAASISTSTRILAPAPTSAARKPRCSNRSKARRPAALQAAVPGDVRPVRRPTVINNTETLASVLTSSARAPDWFGKIGVANSGDPSCSRWSATSYAPGNYEIRWGTPFAGLLEWPAACATVALQGGDPGGRRRRCCRRRDDGSDDGLRQHRQGRLDARLGAVIVMDDTAAWSRCSTASRISTYEESAASARRAAKARAGCRVVHRIETGRASEDLDLLTTCQEDRGGTICALGDAAAMPVLGFMHFETIPVSRGSQEVHGPIARRTVPTLGHCCPGGEWHDGTGRHGQTGSNRNMAEDQTIEIEVDGTKLAAQPGQMLMQVRMRPASASAFLLSQAFCRSRPTAACAWSRSRRRPNRCRPARRQSWPGMKVFTRSPLARKGAKGTMEFLLINHPLDCPICDQGGECELQDVAMGYGGDVSRYTERKRGPRRRYRPADRHRDDPCIHCTRCVRFGGESPGLRNWARPAAAKHTVSASTSSTAVASELSGNVIDLSGRCLDQ